MGFMNAATFFSIEQMKNSMFAITDPASSADRFRRTLDSLSRAMVGDTESDANSYRESRMHRMERAAEPEVNAFRDPEPTLADLSGRKA